MSSSDQPQQFPPDSPLASEQDSFLLTGKASDATVVLDPVYECDAPHYVDLGAETMSAMGQTPLRQGTETVDRWFDNKDDTPLSQRSILHGEALYEPTSDSLVLDDEQYAASGAQQPFTGDEESFLLPQNYANGSPVPADYLGMEVETPRPQKSNPFDISTAPVTPARFDILDENTPTPRPAKSQSTTPVEKSPTVAQTGDFVSAAVENEEMRKEESQVQAEEEEEDDLPKRFGNLRMNRFTPMKSSRLAQEIKFEPEEVKQADSRADSPTMGKAATHNLKAVPVLVAPPKVIPSKETNKLRKMAAVNSFVPNKSTKPLTIPVEFKFSQRPVVPKAKTIVSANSISTSAPVKQAPNIGEKKTTVPKPFKFQLPAVSKPVVVAAPEKSPYVPLAERVRAFTKTPDRFKKNPAPAPVTKLTKPAATHVTVPHSPKFLLKDRIKKEKIMSTEERELLEVQKASNFKARPVDPRVLNSAGDLGVPRIKKTILTVPHSPHLTKVMKTRTVGKQPVPPPAFKARPVDPRILQSAGDLGVPRIKKVAPTIPHSPHLTKPVHKPVVVEQPASPPRVVKARPYVAPKPFQPKIQHRLVKPLDFKLPGEELSERRKQQLEEKKRTEEEELEQQRIFKAKPIILGYEGGNFGGSVEMPPLTHPKSPFLMTKIRGTQHRRVLEEKIKHEEHILKQKAEFHAHPILEAEVPFVPKKSDRAPTENEPLHLNTEVRATARKAFEEETARHEKHVEMIKKKMAEEEEDRAKMEIRMLRKQAEFRANPVRHVLPFEPKKSDKPLTEPISPHFAERRRRLQQ